MNVVDFKSNPDQNVIDAIKRLLNEARTGEIQGIAYVVMLDDKCTANGWSGMNKNNMAMIAELEIVKTEIINEYVDMRNEHSE